MKIEFIFLISTILALCSSDCKARAGSASRNDCATATSQAELLQRARENFQNRRFLLSSIDFSGAAAVACSADSRAEAGLGYARSLYELGETGAARSEWKKIAAFKEVADSLRLSAQLQLALLLGEESPTMLPAAKDVLSVWRAKGSPASYLGAVASTGFDKQLKVELSHLRPDYSDIKSPLLAGLASGIIPGAGQAYTGMYQTAAISFVLNGLFLLSTVELAKKKLGFSATITGIAFSTVYLGNIISAVQGAKALNRAHSNQEDEKLAAKITEMVESH